MLNRPVIIWGFSQAMCNRSEPIPSHAYIHEGYYRGFQRAGMETKWLDDLPENASAVPGGAIVFCCNIRCRFMPQRDDLLYIGHNLEPHQTEHIDPAQRLSLQYWFTGCPGEAVSGYTSWDASTRTLFMPWATDLMPEEIDELVTMPGGNTVWWVGSVWQDKGMGNEDEIAELQRSLDSRGIALKVSRVPADDHRRLIRASVIAPSIMGAWQVNKGYIPCRALKNASYGQMVITNSQTVATLFDWNCIYNKGIRDGVEIALSTPSALRTAMTLAAKKIVREQHTYLHRAQNLLEFLKP